MRKIYTLAAIIIFAAVTKVNAQVNVGIGAGVTHSSLKGDAMSSFNNILDFADGFVTTRPRTGFYAGGFVEMPLGDIVSLQPGIYYSQKGQSIRASIPGDKMNIIGMLGAGARADLVSHYIDIPVVFKAEVAKGLQVFAGPQLSYLAKSNLKADASILGVSLFKSNIDVSDNFNKADWALTGGVGYTFDNGLSINAAYDHGLSRIDKNSALESFNRSFKVGLGYKF